MSETKRPRTMTMDRENAARNARTPFVNLLAKELDAERAACDEALAQRDEKHAAWAATVKALESALAQRDALAEALEPLVACVCGLAMTGQTKQTRSELNALALAGDAALARVRGEVKP